MALKQGRPRKTTTFPPHVDPAKVPDYCYWDAQRKHWYTIYTEEGKQRRRKIAGPSARLSDLHSAMESRQFNEHNNVAWLYAKFQKSPQFKSVSESSRYAWNYALEILKSHPTKVKGYMMHQVPLPDWNPALFQSLMDSVGAKHGPSAARTVRSFISRLFNWGAGRNYSQPSPIGRPEMPPERRRQRLPDMLTINKIQALARDRGAQKQKKGSCAPYIWPVMVILRKCRLRGIEARTMTDADLLEEGIDCRRRKGSRTNITLRDEMLEEALDAAIARRNSIWRDRGIAFPIQPQDRLVFVNVSGGEISRGAWQNSWGRLMRIAVDEELITQEQRFGAHDLKRRGITDTPGNQAEKMEASGHKSRTGIAPYDHSKPTVLPAPD